MPGVFLLSDIFGQTDAVNWLRQSYLADRLPHAMVFAGPVGVGKAATARALARLFLCEHPTEDRSCGVCDSCRVLDAGNHPDFHVITKELIRYHDKTGKSKGISLSINVIRPEVIEPAGRKAVMGRGKVFVIEQAELMNQPAQNALLKTLEEPAGRTLIILLTDQPTSLLATIRSRCQTVQFATLDENRVRKELVARGIDPAIAADAAALSRGSLGIAVKWIEDDVIAPARQLIAMIDQLFSGRPPGDLPAWFKAAADAYAAKQLERDALSSKDQATREGLTLYLLLAGEHIRRRMAEGPPEDDLEAACSAIDALVQAETFLDSNVNVSLIFQQLSMKLERAH
ncbi:MAG TPA: DNA polymerase III subunit delta' [Tepidisphaeraceae bacterium]|jgi:DNA polymerase-3 subunit delta'|nr:DNA polymerase III subunit delta' [Tepidisphaeraceae bacterium]